MPKPTEPGKRRVPTSSSMYAEDIELIQAAARAKQVTMSEFIREASIREAKRVNDRAAKKSAA